MAKSIYELREEARLAVMDLANALDVDVAASRSKQARELRKAANEAIAALADAVGYATAEQPVRRGPARTFIAKNVTPHDNGDGGYLGTGETEITLDTSKDGLTVRAGVGSKRFMTWEEVWCNARPQVKHYE